jgi:small subunit ribosomal protein S6
MNRQYETLYIIRPHLSEEENKKVIETFQSWITSAEGEITSVKEIGLRDLATEFKDHQKGYYVLCHFDGSNKTLEKMNDNLRISEDIIRYMTLRLDEVEETTEEAVEEEKG